MIRAITFLFGLAFLAIGGLGYMPEYSTDGLLFGMFEIDRIQSMVHLACGGLAILATFSAYYARLYLRLLGLVFGALTIAGFVRAGDLYITHANQADNVLNLTIAAIALFFGFIYKSRHEL